MFKVLIIAKDAEERKRVASALESEGFAPLPSEEVASALRTIEKEPPDLILLDLEGHTFSSPGIRELLAQGKEQSIPFLLLLPPEELENHDYSLGLEDFSLKPTKPAEIVARIKQIRWKKSKIDTREVIKRGDLVIDLARYEVYLNRQAISLTFKEFELLRFLAINSGRVISRDTLLNKVWGYDYYGGTRTVDVHIRRLRSKIEDSTHSFIETVRNVGYRFKENK